VNRFLLWASQLLTIAAAASRVQGIDIVLARDADKGEQGIAGIGD
jgi:hypothetical protein